MKPIIALLALVVLTSAAHAQVYRCTIDGRVVFSDQPCAEDAVELDVRPAAGVGTGVGTDSAWSSAREGADAMARDRRLREIDREMDAIERRITRDTRAMDHEIARLRHSMRYSNNNLAGATRDVSLTQEMQAVAQRYQVRADADRSRLDTLKVERERLLR